MDAAVRREDCELLAEKPAEESSQYLFVHKPTRSLYLIGENVGSMEQIESIGNVDQSPTRVLHALFRERTFESPFYSHIRRAVDIPSSFVSL